MTKLLIFDTETTGVDPAQARLVELAAILQTENYTERYSTLIQPDGFEIPPGATAIHGISTEQAMDEGIPLREALSKLTELVEEARKRPEPFIWEPVPHRLVAHNLRYDIGVCAGEFRRSGTIFPLNYLSPFCTMASLTPRCKLPGRYGRYKWPRLEEAWKFCFDGELVMQYFPEAGGAGDVKQHRALFDAEACRRIYLHGLEQQWWSHE